jgi:hypothetical protein
VLSSGVCRALHGADESTGSRDARVSTVTWLLELLAVPIMVVLVWASSFGLLANSISDPNYFIKYYNGENPKTYLASEFAWP